MKKTKEKATLKAIPSRELSAELARKIASFMGREEKRITEIPGLSLHRRTSPTPPCRATYHPGLLVVAQGSKRVNLGRTSFIYDGSHFLLTAVDLPIVSWVAEASEKVPCLVLSLSLDVSIVRELLGREEIHVAEAPSDSPAISIGENTPEFLNACCRLVDLLDSPKDIPFLSSLIQREIIYRILERTCGSSLARRGNTRRSKPPDGKSDWLDRRELCQASPRGRTRTACEYGRIHATSSFPDAHCDESAAVSKTTPASVSAEPDAEQWSRCGQRSF